MEARSAARLIIIAVLLNVALCDDDMSSMCPHIQNAFMNGMMSFKFEDDKGKFLADNGFLGKHTDMFQLIYGAMPLELNKSMQFMQANYAIRGTQMLAYMMDKEFQGNKMKIHNFFDMATKCLKSSGMCMSTEYDCDDMAKMYRTLDGSCNNLETPSLGAAMTEYSRVLPAEYDDNVFEIRKDLFGNPLKSVRAVTEKVYMQPQLTMAMRGFAFNVGWYIFGMMLSHDVGGHVNVHHGQASPMGVRCCSEDYQHALPSSQSYHGCLPFEIPPGDKYFGQMKPQPRCHNYIRTQPIFKDNCTVSSAEQVNMPSHFIDLSVVYPLSMEKLAMLRMGSGGMFKLDEKMIMIKKENCEKNCYFTGDFRSAGFASLAVVHSMLMRLHNMVAMMLAEKNPQWNDDMLFFEARKVVIGVYQHIVYNEYVPSMLGQTSFAVAGDGDYDKNMDPRTLNEFSNTAFRYLHIYTPDTWNLYNEKMENVMSSAMSKVMHEMPASILETNYEDVVRGLLMQQVPLTGHGVEVLNKLVGGLDLIAVDIQRGRDHGFPPYWKYREMCGLPPIRKWGDLLSSMSRTNVNILKQLYTTVMDIDLYVGASLELKATGSTMGQTFSCISKLQFLRYKRGDRFFYSHKNVFSEAQLMEIRKMSFGKLLCMTTKVGMVPMMAFYAPSMDNGVVDCSSLGSFDASAWKV